MYILNMILNIYYDLKMIFYILICLRFCIKLINILVKVEQLLIRIYVKILRINFFVRMYMLDGVLCYVVDVNGCLLYDDD